MSSQSDWDVLAPGTQRAQVIRHFTGRVVADTAHQFMVDATIFGVSSHVNFQFEDDRVYSAQVFFTKIGLPSEKRSRLFRQIRESLPPADEGEPMLAVRLNGESLFGRQGLLSSSASEIVYQVVNHGVAYRLSFKGADAASLEAGGEVLLEVSRVAEAIWEHQKPANQSLEPTPTAGTSAAEQPLVPAAVAAHL